MGIWRNTVKWVCPHVNQKGACANTYNKREDPMWAWGGVNYNEKVRAHLSIKRERVRK